MFQEMRLPCRGPNAPSESTAVHSREGAGISSPKWCHYFCCSHCTHYTPPPPQQPPQQGALMLQQGTLRPPLSPPFQAKASRAQPSQAPQQER